MDNQKIIRRWPTRQLPGETIIDWNWIGGTMERDFLAQQVHDSFYGDREENGIPLMKWRERDKAMRKRDRSKGRLDSHEDSLSAALYDWCSLREGTPLQIGADEYWLFGLWCNVNYDGCQADLVAVRRDGGLVVIEVKKASNNEVPLEAIGQGLGYLACLLGPSNFRKLCYEFRDWREQRRLEGKIPVGFDNDNFCVRRSDGQIARPEAIVLAPDGYYRNRVQANERAEMEIAVGNRRAPASRVLIGFATSEFFRTTAGQWYIAFLNQPCQK